MVDTFTGSDRCLEELAFRSAYRVGGLCQELGCSPRYVHLMFLRDVGLPPKQWLSSERMVLARRKLEGGLTPEQVASDLGFMSLHTFCKQFRKHHHLTPAKFVRSLRRAAGPGVDGNGTNGNGSNGNGHKNPPGLSA